MIVRINTLNQCIKENGCKCRIGLMFLTVAFSVSLLLITQLHCIHAKDSQPDEYHIKAAFMFNFANFVEWPSSAFPDASSPITIGVVGDDPFGSILDDTVRSKTINSRKLLIKRFKRYQDIEYCNILFVCSSEQRHLSQILDNQKANSSLTVSEIDRFTQRGGIIRFTMQNSKIGLEINPETARKANIKISSKLMKLAKVVKD